MALGGATRGEPTPARQRFAVAVWWHGRAGTPGMALGMALGLALGIRCVRRVARRRAGPKRLLVRLSGSLWRLL